MNSFSWMTRSSFACVSMVIVPISSKKIEPPSATSKRPFLLAIAPVKAPLTWPKRLDSSRSAGIEPELTVTKGAPERGECVWIARATSSLPVPLSPSTRIVERDGPARRTSSNTLRMPGGLADDAPEAEAQRELLAQAPVLLGQPPRLGALAQGQEHFLVLEGLRDVVEGAEAHRLDGALDRGVGRHDHDDGVGIAPQDVAQHVEARPVGQHQVEQDDVVGLGLEQGHGLGGGRRRGDLVALPRQQGAEDVADDLLVVDDEDPHEGDPAGTSGSSTRASAPPPSRADSAIVPPWRRTMSREIARPSPVPPDFFVV